MELVVRMVEIRVGGVQLRGMVLMLVTRSLSVRTQWRCANSYSQE